MKTEKRRLRQRLLSGLGTVLSLCLLPLLVINIIIIVQSRLHPEEMPSVLGLSPMAVVTNSMSPVIDGGDMIFTRKAEAESLRVGDIIAFYDPSFAAKVVNTHRIVSVETTETGGLLFTTRGDANSGNDPEPVPAENVVGLYTGRIRGLGKLAMYMRTVPGLILFVLVPVIIFASAEILRIRREEKAGIRENLRLREELESLRQAAGHAES